MLPVRQFQIIRMLNLLRLRKDVSRNLCNNKINRTESKLVHIATKQFSQSNNYSYCSRLILARTLSGLSENNSIDSITFDKVSDDTLESLTDYFEELVESDSKLSDADVSYSSGVLTVSFGSPHGTYVINKQSPNKQIWLSSPVSGPKRYDFISTGGFWVYKHTGETLHRLLQDEIPKVVNANIDFSKCVYCRL